MFIVNLWLKLVLKIFNDSGNHHVVMVFNHVPIRLVMVTPTDGTDIQQVW